MAIPLQSCHGMSVQVHVKFLVGDTRQFGQDVGQGVGLPALDAEVSGRKHGGQEVAVEAMCLHQL